MIVIIIIIILILLSLLLLLLLLLFLSLSKWAFKISLLKTTFSYFMWSVLSLKYKRKIDLHLTTESKWTFSVRNYFGGGGVPYVPAFVTRTKFVFSKFELSNFRSSRLQVFFKIRVLKNFSYFTGKPMCRNLFLIKLQVVLKRDSNTGLFL